MKRQGRILIIDDDERWRTLLSKTLQQGRFHVDNVETTKQGVERLNESFYHLLVLDIRMQDSETDNIEGMEMLKTLNECKLASDLKIIMLSAYGTREQMREAFRGYEVTDFLDKQNFDDQKFLQQVSSIFAKDMRINLELGIAWQGVSGPEQAVINLWLAGKRVKHNTLLQEQLGQELDDLLCRLFYRANNLLVRPLTGGMSGMGILHIQPFYKSGGGHAVVVKFGEANKIEEEYRNFQSYVSNYIGGSRSTTVHALRRSARFGSIMYSLLGAADDRFITFDNFYTQANIFQITDLIERLFMSTCGLWYANRGILKPCNLTEQYLHQLNFTYERLNEASHRLRGVRKSGQTINFTILSEKRSFTNPILATKEQFFVRATYECITHGDLNASSVLVDNAGNPWLIDFQSTGLGHIVRDVAELDSVVRICLLTEADASLDERLKMEEALLSIDKFSQLDDLDIALSTNNQAISRAYATSVYLRKIARRLIDSKLFDDMSEYYIASMYYALNYLRFSTLSTVQREHALLSAALLCERLGIGKQSGVENKSLPLLSEGDATLTTALGSPQGTTELTSISSQKARSKKRTRQDDGSTSTTYRLAQSFFKKAGLKVQPLGTNVFQASPQREHGNIENLQNMGRILVACFNPGQTVTISDVEGLIEQTKRNEEKDAYAYIIFEEDLERGVIRRLWVAKQQDKQVIIPIHTGDIRQTLLADQEEPGYAELKLATLRRAWSMLTDPYASIDSLADPQWFFGAQRKSEAKEILAKLKDGVNMFAVYGMRRVGKTALVNHLLRDCVDAKFPTAKIICQPFSDYTYVNLLDDIYLEWQKSTKSLFPRLKIPVKQRNGNYALDTVSDFESDIRALADAVHGYSANTSRLVLVLDEMDQIFPNQASSDEIYKQYCAFAQVLKKAIEIAERKVAISIVAVMEYKRMHEIDLFPGREQFQNPFYHRFEPFRCRMLDKKDWIAMVQNIGALVGLEYDLESLDIIYTKSAGHPQITRNLCSCLVELRNKEKIDSVITREAVSAALEYFLANPLKQAYYLDVTFWRNVYSIDLETDRRIMKTLAEYKSLSREKLILLGDFSGTETEAKLIDNLDRLVDLQLIRQDEVTGAYSLVIPLFQDWIRKEILGIEVEYT